MRRPDNLAHRVWAGITGVLCIIIIVLLLMPDLLSWLS